MKHSRFWKYTLLGCLLMLAAQMPASGNLIIHSIDQSAFPEVEMTFSLWDENGLPVKGLTMDDILLQEDGGSQFHPVSLKLETSADVAVMLVLDVSGSMSGQDLQDARTAARLLLARLDGQDQAALIAFSDGVNSDPLVMNYDKEVGFSSDLTGLYDLLDAVQATGGTELYNALEKAVRMTSSLPQGHRAILLLSDGKNDPEDVGDRQSAISIAKENNIPIFVIGLGDATDENYLMDVTSGTGGIYRSSPGSAELADLFTEMADLLKTQYRLTYSSGLSTDGAEHTLDLSIQSSIQTWTIEQKITAIRVDDEAQAQEDSVTSQSGLLASDKETAMSAPDNRLGLWIALGLTGVAIAALTVARALTKYRKNVAKCSKCGHKLNGETTCPVCGTEQKKKG